MHLVCTCWFWRLSAESYIYPVLKEERYIWIKSPESVLLNESLLLSHYETMSQATKLLQACRAGFGKLDELDALQRRHQQLFIDCYMGQERLKHHYRLHLPKMYKQLCYVDCWAQEVKHKMFKDLARSLDTQFRERTGQSGKVLLPRLLYRSALQLADDPWVHRMREPYFEEKEVKQVTGLDESCTSKGYHYGSLEFAEGDVLCVGDVCGVVNFVLLPRNPYVFLSMLELHASWNDLIVQYRLTNEMKAFSLITEDRVFRPHWWHQEGQQVLCLF